MKILKAIKITIQHMWNQTTEEFKLMVLLLLGLLLGVVGSVVFVL